MKRVEPLESTRLGRTEQRVDCADGFFFIRSAVTPLDHQVRGRIEYDFGNPSGEAAQPEITQSNTPTFGALVAAASSLAGSRFDIAIGADSGFQDTGWAARPWRSDPDRAVACDFAAISMIIVGGAVGSNRLREDLSNFRTFTYIGPGRYQFGSDIYEVSDVNVPGQAEALHGEIGLGERRVEWAMDRITEFVERPFNQRNLSIRFTDDAGRFRYFNDEVRLDVADLRLVLLTDVFFMRQQMFSLPACFENSTENKLLDHFCSNVRARINETASLRSQIETTSDNSISRYSSVGDRLRSWRQSYGDIVVRAYLDEAWSYISEAARFAKMNHARECTGVICARGGANTELARFALPAPGVMRSLELVLAHELAHHVLGHSNQLINELSKGDQSQRCDASSVIEIEADLAGAALLRLAHEQTGRMDYWGRTLNEDDSILKSRGAYLNWTPFFGGYAEHQYEQSEDCAYISAEARHVLFHVIYSLRDYWREAE